MAKITVKAVTRLQKFLAAIAGDGVAPNPITDKEKLLYNIAENVNNGGGSSDGALIVNTEIDSVAGTITLKKTWKEIKDAGFAVIKLSHESLGEGNLYVDSCTFDKANPPLIQNDVWSVAAFNHSGEMVFTTDSEDGFPSTTT